MSMMKDAFEKAGIVVGGEDLATALPKFHCVVNKKKEPDPVGMYPGRIVLSTALMNAMGNPERVFPYIKDNNLFLSFGGTMGKAIISRDNQTPWFHISSIGERKFRLAGSWQSKQFPLLVDTTRKTAMLVGFDVSIMLINAGHKGSQPVRNNKFTHSKAVELIKDLVQHKVEPMVPRRDGDGATETLSHTAVVVEPAALQPGEILITETLHIPATSEPAAMSRHEQLKHHIDVVNGLVHELGDVVLRVLPSGVLVGKRREVREFDL